MKPQITIKDLAKELGISTSTVSRALQNHPDISKATIARVQECAKKHHYKPNPIALSLKMQRTNIIGVMVPEMIHNFFASVVAGIEDVAGEKGYNVILCQTSEDYAKEVKCINTLLTAHASGILTSVSKNTTDYSHFKDVVEEDTPIVFYDRICPEIESDSVVTDDYTGAYNLVSHLIRSGCKRVAFYGAPEHLKIAQDRKRGYMNALKDNRMMVDESLLFECDNRTNAIELTSKLLKSANHPDAFFAVNDDAASGIITAAKRAGKRVPQDVSVCGFGDGTVAQISDPSITTVEQNGYKIGAEACHLLIKRIESKEAIPFTQKVVPTKLIIRESTK